MMSFMMGFGNYIIPKTRETISRAKPGWSTGLEPT